MIPLIRVVGRWGSKNLVLLLLVATSISARLPHISRSLWLDEAWVANGIISDLPRQWFFYDAWSPSPPPIFALLSRALLLILGPSNVVFRLVPLAAAVLAIVAFYFYATRIFSSRLALLSSVAFAFIPGFCIYSRVLKQYTSDLAVAVVALLCLWRYWEDENWRDKGYWTILGLFVVFPFLSYSTVMLLPLALVVIASVERNIRRVATALTFSASAFLVSYICFIRPNSTQGLWSFFSLEFPASYSPFALSIYFLRAHSRMMLSMVPQDFGRAAVVIMALCAVVAFVGIFVGVSRHRRGRILLFCGMPWATLLSANLARQFPLGPERLSLFLLPSFVIVPALALETLAELLRRWIRIPRLRPSFVDAALLSLILFLGLATTIRHRHLTSWEDADGAISHVWSIAQSSDHILVHSSLSEQVKLYGKIKALPARKLRFGNTGWPCCPKDKPFALTNHDPDYFAADLKDKLPSAGVVWFLATGRGGHWKSLGRNEPQLLRSFAVARGCKVNSNTSFHNIVLYQIVCPGTNTS